MAASHLKVLGAVMGYFVSSDTVTLQQVLVRQLMTEMKVVKQLFCHLSFRNGANKVITG